MSNSIPLSQPDIHDDDRLAVLEVLSGASLSRGPTLRQFEAALAARCDRRFCAGVSSGTAALHCVFNALGISAGDEVLLPSFTVPACANAVIAAGAKPVFVDIDATTWAIDPDEAARQISPKTRALMMVHPFGQPAAVKALAALCEAHELHLIEDACEALGGSVNERPIGSFGVASVFGFYPNKQITAGEGGAVLCDDSRLDAAVRAHRNQGRNMDGRWLDQDTTGLNYRLSDINAALAYSQLSRLDTTLERLANVARRYDQQLRDCDVELPPRVMAMSWFCYVVLLPSQVDRDEVLTAMQHHGIQCGRYFAPLHWQPAMKNTGDDCSLPITESVAMRALALPFFARISENQQRRVSESLHQALGPVAAKSGSNPPAPSNASMSS